MLGIIPVADFLHTNLDFPHTNLDFLHTNEVPIGKSLLFKLSR